MKISAAPVLLAVALFTSACNEAEKPKQAESARPVLVALVHYAPRQAVQILPGIVKARVEGDLAFRVAGKLARRLVDTGAHVKQRDVLAELDGADFRLQLEQAQAELTSAKSAQSQANAEGGRVATLHRPGWSATSDLDRVEASSHQADSAVERAARAVELATNAQTYASLQADADGTVVSVAAEPGQVLSAGAPVLRLAHDGEREAAVAAPETLAPHLRAAQASAEFWALPGLSTPAVLRELSPVADAATRTYAARFSLTNPPPDLQLGMSLNLTLAQEGAMRASLPLGALFDNGHGPMVWTVARDTGALKAASVVIESYGEQSVFIASGVEEGAEVVALGAHKLDSGQKVRAVDHLAGL